MAVHARIRPPCWMLLFFLLLFVFDTEAVQVVLPNFGMKLIILDQDVDAQLFREALEEAAKLHLYSRINRPIRLETTVLKVKVDDEFDDVSLSVLRVGFEGSIDYDFPKQDQAETDLTNAFGQDTGFWDFCKTMVEDSVLARTGKLQIAVGETILSEGSLINDENDENDDALQPPILALIGVICGLLAITIVVAVVLIVKKRRAAKLERQKQARRSSSKLRHLELSTRERSLSSSWNSSLSHSSLTGSFQLKNSSIINNSGDRLSLSGGQLHFSPRTSPIKKKFGTIAPKNPGSPPGLPQRALTQLEKKQKALEKRQTQNSSKLISIMEDLDELEEEEESEEFCDAPMNESNTTSNNSSNSSDLMKFTGNSNSNSLSLSPQKSVDDTEAMKLNSGGNSDLIQLNDSLSSSGGGKNNFHMSMHMSTLGNLDVNDLQDSLEYTDAMNQQLNLSDNSDLIKLSDNKETKKNDSAKKVSNSVNRRSDSLNSSPGSKDMAKMQMSLHMSMKLGDSMFDMNFDESTTNTDSGNIDTSLGTGRQTTPISSPQRQQMPNKSDSPRYSTAFMMDMNMSRLDNSCMLDLNFEESSHHARSSISVDDCHHTGTYESTARSNQGSSVYDNIYHHRGGFVPESSSHHQRIGFVAESNICHDRSIMRAASESRKGSTDDTVFHDVGLEDESDAVTLDVSDTGLDNECCFDGERSTYWADDSVDLEGFAEAQQELGIPKGHSDYEAASPTPQKSSHFHFT